jgi:CheY-like chemotaxis protein
MKTILIVGREWKFRALLRAQLREEGYEALAFETLQDAEAERASGAALVFDTAECKPEEWRPQLEQLAASLPVVVVAGADEPVDIAWARILRRPVRLADVVSALQEVIHTRP